MITHCKLIYFSNYFVIRKSLKILIPKIKKTQPLVYLVFLRGNPNNRDVGSMVSRLQSVSSTSLV